MASLYVTIKSHMDARTDRADPDPIFKALADPTRRRVLDLLRQRPRTTGELAAAFPALSRFAVMKHLGVLEGTGLVIVRRRGRERWNHLNAVPLREFYERWVATFDDRWAASMLAIGRLAEDGSTTARSTGQVQEEEIAMSTVAQDPSNPRRAEQQRESAVGLSEREPTTIRSLVVEQEHRIAAAPEQVWVILTTRIGEWWDHPYRLHEGDAAIRLEPRVGGTLAEHWGDGDAAAWGTVSRIEHGRVLELLGPCGMEGAVYGAFCFTLEGDGDGTRLQLSHHAFGEISATTERGYDKGWQEMLVKLKQLAEQG